jgi:transcriptional regulator GlxA family with amidase domain
MQKISRNSKNYLTFEIFCSFWSRWDLNLYRFSSRKRAGGHARKIAVSNGVVAFLINRRVYKGKDEIEKAKEYIENHWLEKFDLNEAAKAACFSRAHFTKLFKKHTGITPHEYYINYKINKLKEKLLDTNLSITQAFAVCNMEYNGHTAGLFREKTGVSPSDYRKALKDTANYKK